MEEIRDIHKTQQKMDSIERKIQTDRKILPCNKKHIEKFTEVMKANALKATTMRKHLFSLWFVSVNCNKDFRRVTKDDVIKICAKIEQQKWTDATKHAHLVAIKKFFKWLRNVDEKGVYPPEVRWISTSERGSSNKLPEDLLTEDEVEKMLSVADNPRDKAFLITLYETGARIGEMLNAKIKHIVFTDFGAYIMLNGKTGMRRVTVIASAPALASFLDVHPQKNNNEAFLFMTKMNRSIKGYVPLTYAGARKILIVLAESAGVKKRIHPHLLRHSSATRAANFLTESQMKEYYGWTKGSDMPSVYVHLSQRDTEDAIKRMNGIESKSENKVKTTIRKCGRCKMNNSPGSKFCNSCGNILDLETALNVNTLLQNVIAKAPELLSKSDEEILKEHKAKQ